MEKEREIAKNKHVVPIERREAFFREYVEICKKYDVSIGHEDGHGAFIVEEYDEHNIGWLEGAFEPETHYINECGLNCWGRVEDIQEGDFVKFAEHDDDGDDIDPAEAVAIIRQRIAPMVLREDRKDSFGNLVFVVVKP